MQVEKINAATEEVKQKKDGVSEAFSQQIQLMQQQRQMLLAQVRHADS